MLRSLLPSRAFNRHFQKTEWAAVPLPLPCHPDPFPLLCCNPFSEGSASLSKSITWVSKHPSQCRTVFCAYACGWRVSPGRVSVGCPQKSQPQCRAKAGPWVGRTSGSPLLPASLAEAGGGGGGGSGRNKALLKTLQLCSADCMLGDAAWTICVGCQGWETTCGGRFGFLGCLHSSQ